MIIESVLSFLFIVRYLHFDVLRYLGILWSNKQICFSVSPNRRSEVTVVFYHQVYNMNVIDIMTESTNYYEIKQVGDGNAVLTK